MARQPCPHGGVLVGGVVVEDDVDDLADRNLPLDGVEEADELLMTMTLHVLSDDRAVEHVHGGEQRRRAVSHAIVGHGSGAAFLDRQPQLRPVERLDLTFLVEAEHDGMRRRIDLDPDDIAQFGDELSIRTRATAFPGVTDL